MTADEKRAILENEYALAKRDFKKAIRNFEIAKDAYETFHFRSDQMNVTYPITFPCVEIELEPEDALSDYANAIMHKHNVQGMNEDLNMWYRFYFTAYELPDGIHAENAIEIVPENCDEPHNDNYIIDLDEEEQAMMLVRLSELAIKNGTTLVELMREARKETML